MSISKRTLALLLFSAAWFGALQAQPADTPERHLADRSFLAGRNYYVLRSGSAKMILQADRVSLGPAFTFLLFDAEQPRQSARKRQAWNYTPEMGFGHSALEVVMKGFPLTALGTQTETRWVMDEGVPGVEAQWWASGVKVRETITPAGAEGVFRRTIRLDPCSLIDSDTVVLRLSLPGPASFPAKGLGVWCGEQVSVGCSFSPGYAGEEGSSYLATRPIVLHPGEPVILETYLFAGKGVVPAGAIPFARKALQDEWARTNTLATGDTLVRHLYNVSRYTLPGCVSDSGRMDAGIFCYGGQWVRDASHVALGVIHIGQFELARAVLLNILENMISPEGTTMIYSGFEEPDREQLDQMGELMLALKSYVDWSGDTSLVTAYRDRLVAMVERPLNPSFLDETGMVHNRREYWERVFDDAYELTYQAWVVTGLRLAAEMAPLLRAEERTERWLAAAGRMQQAMLHHPTRSLTEDGHLVKRRNRTGEVARRVEFPGRKMPGSPAAVETHHDLMPDAGMAVPISLGVVDPASELARNTLDLLETLWNLRWSFGGYERYHSSSQMDQPGPWTFGTTFILRGQHEAGMYDRSRRALRWLAEHGGQSGLWHEQIPILKYQEERTALIPWTTAEVAYFMVHHMLGVKFEGGNLVIAPRLYAVSGPVEADLRYRDGRIRLTVDGSGPVVRAWVNDCPVEPDARGRILLPTDFRGGTIRIQTATP